MSGISAQKSKLEIATGTGGAKAITAIAAGNPTIITSAGHGFTNGTVAALATLVGTIAASLNGTNQTISNVTANTYAVNVDTTGLAYTSGGTATPNTYTQVKGLLSFDGFDGTADELDVTDLDSDAKEFVSGIKDEGKFGFEIKNLTKTDPGQQALRAARASGAVVGMKLTLPDTSVASFNTIVKSMPTGGGVNAVLKGKVDCRISGSVVWA